MASTATRTRYAADRDGRVCLLVDVRGRARENSLQVYSYGQGRVVSLPRKLIRDETPNAKRWGAVSVPRWLINREGLWSPNLPPVMSAFCREHSYDMRTPQMIRDEGERGIAEWIVSDRNKYRRLPGQNWGASKADYANGRAFQ